jgi:predicted DNA-binding transcriptional regulator YafY
MRADRLVAALLFLQARGRVTAAELAAELEVSVKTARRDLEALAVAGIPVYSQPGRHGGWQLIGGARTDLSGLTEAEAERAATSTVLDPASWVPSRCPRPQFLDELRGAVVAGVQVRLGYADRARTETTRLVHPLGFVDKGSTWYLVGWADYVEVHSPLEVLEHLAAIGRSLVSRYS